MELRKIAVPSKAPGGLDSERDEHFGHCALFTLVELEQGRISQAEVLANAPHGAGGCLTPVGLLADRGVEAVVVNGLGKRPLQALQEAGIRVYYAPSEIGDVRGAADAVLAGELALMTPLQACSGHGHCHG